MVKNSQGGSKAKGLARKNFAKNSNELRIAKDDGEIYAQAIKVMGGSIASAIDIDGNPLIAHIRGKFRGRGKRDNFISPGTWLLVGLHSWEGDKSSTSEPRNCDILEVYNDSDKNKLKNSVININWNTFITNDNKSVGSSSTNTVDNGDIIFADETHQEHEELIASQATTKSGLTKISTDDGVDIDVDDI